MSLSPVVGRISIVAFAIDRQVLALDVERDHAVPVDQLDLLDLADVDAGDAHGLPLARNDGLGRLELGLELEGLLLEDRDPQALLLEDVVRDPDRENGEHRHRHEVAEVDRG